MAATRSISMSESITMMPTPAETACSISSNDLLFPCSSMFSGLMPPFSATASSPPVHTSIPIPMSAIHRATSTQINAFAA
jgi:hypothetical protein